MNMDNNDKNSGSDVSEVPVDRGVLSDRVAINRDVSCRVEDSDHALLFNPDTDNSILIDRTGLLIWRYIEEPRDVADIIKYLMTCFSGCPTPDMLRQDVEVYLRDLIPEFATEII